MAVALRPRPSASTIQLAVGLARAGLRRSTGPLRGNGCGVVRAVASRRGRRRVGGHLRRNGRICRTSARAATAAHGQAGRLQVTAGGLAPDPGGLFDPPQRPAEAPQREDLLSFLFAQDVAHAGQERRVPDRRQRLGPLSEMAGFQPSTNGRIWVSTEGIERKLAINFLSRLGASAGALTAGTCVYDPLDSGPVAGDMHCASATRDARSIGGGSG